MSNIMIEVLQKKRIAVITMKNAPLNICDRYFYQEITDAFREINLIDGLCAVILRSDCRHFSAGGSLEEIQMCSTPLKRDMLAGTAAACMEAIYTCQYPTIASVNGKAIGAGAAIAACCDICIASEDALFSIPEMQVGVISAAEFLEMVMPRRLARYYIWTGDFLTAQELKHWGAVLDVVPLDKLKERTMEIAEKIAAQSPLALAYSKANMNHNDNERLTEKFMKGWEYTLKYHETEDFQEALDAIHEKRKPTFKGR